MTAKIIAYIMAIVKFFTSRQELVLGPLGIVLWFVSAPLIRLFDPTAATYDLAVFQKIVFALICFCIFSFSAWMLIRIQFPKLYDYLDNKFDEDFNSISTNPQFQCDRLKVSFSVLAFYLLALILCALIL
jgi:hypothetical protein